MEMTLYDIHKNNKNLVIMDLFPFLYTYIPPESFPEDNATAIPNKPPVIGSLLVP